MWDKIVALAVVALVILALAANPPKRVTKSNSKPAETSTSRHLWKAEDSVDTEIHISDGAGRSRDLWIVNGRVYEPNGQVDGLPYRITDHTALVDFNGDFGAFIAASDQPRVEFGARFSPARVLFGTVAPDLVVGEDSAGAGVSVYPIQGDFWSHFGVGAWYLYPYDSDHEPNWAFGLSISTLSF